MHFSNVGASDGTEPKATMEGSSTDPIRIWMALEIFRRLRL
jgi:hypothetical protein